MPIQSSSPTYIEAFARVCFENGFNEDEAAAFYKAAHTQDLLDNDPDFRAGFVEALEKFASQNPGAFDIMSPEGKSTSIGAGVGGVLGAASTLLGARKNPLKLLRNTLVGGGAGAVAGRGYQGAVNTADKVLRPDTAGPYMPHWSSPAAPGSAKGPGAPVSKTNFPASALGGYPTDMNVGTPAATGGATNPAVPYPQRMLQANRERLDAIDKQIKDTRTEQNAISTGGARGSELGYRQVGKRLQELESQRGSILSTVNGAVGDMRAEQGRSTRSIDEHTNYADKQLGIKGKRLDTAEAYLRNNRGSQWYEPRHWWERLNNVEGQAQEAHSQVNHYEALKKQLTESRKAVTGPWGPQ